MGSGTAWGVDPPEGLERLTAGPQALVVLWSEDGDEAARVTDALAAAGLLAARLDPAETEELLDLAGSPLALLVDPDLLDGAIVARLAALRAAHPRVRVLLLADGASRAAGMLAAMRAGVTEVLDPEDPAAVERLVPRPTEATERVLAVGAHPDDVEIGCGATLLAHRDAGHPITVLTLSRGAVGGATAERRREAAGAATQLGAELLLGDLPDTRLEHEHGLVPLIERAVAAAQPTTVYVHTASDQHQDHRAVHRATVVAARRVPQLLCYQSPSSHHGFAPTRFVPVEATVEEKVALLEHYRSQSARHYLEPDLVRATARYWARQLTHTRYAEPFEVLRAAGA